MSVESNLEFEDEHLERILREYIENEAQVDDEVLPEPVRWPTQDPEPINEYTTEGYMAMAFPALFPTGGADFRDRSQRTDDLGIAEYFEALIRYKDGRFGSHPRYIICYLIDSYHRFLFWALNTKLRSQAQTQGKVFMRKQIGAADLTVADIQDRLNANDKPAFLKTVQRFMEPIVGLAPFWQKHRRNLMAMVDQLESGHIFFTLSAADTHWPDLHRLIEEARAQSTGGPPLAISTLDPEAAQRRRVDNLTNFPQICAAFLHHRVRLFLQVVKKIPGLEYVDYWCRYEWQFRGSGHLHGVLWLMDGPKVSGRDLDCEVEKQELVDFYSKLVYATAPIANHPRPVVNPCQVLLSLHVTSANPFRSQVQRKILTIARTSLNWSTDANVMYVPIPTVFAKNVRMVVRQDTRSVDLGTLRMRGQLL